MPQYQGVWTLQDAAQLQSRQQWATDPLFENTTLLLQADNAPNAAQNNTFLDSSSNNFAITRNGNTTQGTFTPFSATGWGNYFNGTTDYLTTSTNGWSQLGTGDFTVEAFCYIASYGSYFPIFDARTGGNVPWILGVNSSGYADFFYGTSAGQRLTDTAATGLNAWVHIAAVRSGSTITLYVNGASRATVTYSSAVNGGSSTPSIGRLVDPLYANGYISNARVVVGTAVYTANFNPPTSPLTAITNTSILTCQSNRFRDASTNNFTLTVNGNPSVQAFAPFAPQFQYTPTVIGGSGYFDGSGDYLSNTANDPINFGTQAFTVEFWFYMTTLPGTSFQVMLCPNPQNNNGFQIYRNNTSGNIVYGGINVSENVIISSANFSINTWYHIAVARQGTGTNQTRVFVNGVQTFSYTDANSYNVNGVNIGGYNTSIYFPGYISNVRVVKGTAVYTANFTPPTAPVTNIANTSLLLNFTNAAITDGTMKNNLETVGNAQVSTSIVKYGSGSMYFDGSGDNCLLPYSPGLHLSGDFTIECWIYPLAYGGMILNMGGGSGIAWASYELVNQTDGVNFAASSANSGYDIGSETGSTGRIGTIPLNAWSHLAVTRSGNVYRGFVNGVQGYTQTLALTPYNTLTRGLAVGSNYTTTWGTGTPTSTINGYIDDLRITKGIARYTANFTPPTVALPRQ